MAKNSCIKCTLAIDSKQSFLCCISCSNSVHESCSKLENNELGGSKEKWECHFCGNKNASPSISSNCTSIEPYITKMDTLLQRINVLQEEQKGIVNSLINTCNDASGELMESIKFLNSKLSSFQSELDSCNEEGKNVAQDLKITKEEKQ